MTACLQGQRIAYAFVGGGEVGPEWTHPQGYPFFGERR